MDFVLKNVFFRGFTRDIPPNVIENWRLTNHLSFNFFKAKSLEIWISSAISSSYYSEPVNERMKQSLVGQSGRVAYCDTEERLIFLLRQTSQSMINGGLLVNLSSLNGGLTLMPHLFEKRVGC